MSQWYTPVKHAIDFVFAAVVLLLLSPLFFIIALAVALSSPGPIFFRQRRLGKDGQPFEIYKFRTMSQNAPSILNPDGSTYTGAGDPRVTKIGRILRKTSLDELPQFINVLRGDMSVVGPRPDLFEQYELYDEFAKRKLRGRPGITGYAMIKGRNNIPWRRRIELDVYYLDSLTPWLDFKIAALTLPVLLTGYGVETAPSQATRT